MLMTAIPMRALIAACLLLATAAEADPVRTGSSAFGDWRTDAPGVARLITQDTLPAPYASHSASEPPLVVERPSSARPLVPHGFSVALFASGLEMPRTMRVAPNGDVFVAESSGRISVIRDGGKPVIFAKGLDLPFGIAFSPPGPSPQYVYVGETGRVVRFPYRNGDMTASGKAQVVVPHLPEGGHWTRDVVFSPDGQTMFVSVGSDGNINRDISGVPPAGLPLGAAWGDDAKRANVLAFDPSGGSGRIYATGLRNCSAEAIQPASAVLWCAVNERDGLGDDLPPDYVTHVQAGAFYGWPWFYLGAHPDPRLHGARHDLANQVTVPDVLLQAHSAPLGLTFYDGTQFPAEYRGDAFVALHGSWNRSKRTGYKVVRLRFQGGKATGVYEDFVTGFVVSDRAVWGRPVGVAVMRDGSLLVSEDAGGTIWRVTHP